MIDEKLQSFVESIVKCLVRYGNLSENEAKERIESSSFFKPKTDIERMVLFHEIPYYYAMDMLYGENDPFWYKNPKLWPPPLEAHNY